MEPVEQEANANRPKDTPFRQQRLKACQPVLTPFVVISAFVAVGAIMLTLGFIMWHFNNQTVETVVRYDSRCADAPTTPPFPDNFCTVDFTVARDIPAPAYMYYRLTNFYQNHRRYVSSRADRQLAGQTSTSKSAISDCMPLISVNSSDNYPLFYYPCGLVANSFFIDTFDRFETTTGQPVALDRQNIAWPSDLETKFKAIPAEVITSDPGLAGTPPPDLSQSNLLVNGMFDVTNPDFVVWMRVAGLPTFRKLYARIDAGLPAGDYTIRINNRYSVQRFGNGTKTLVFGSTSFIGGSNAFLGYAYIAVGSICLALAIGFFLANIIKPRQLGDPRLLSWNKNNADF